MIDFTIPENIEKLKETTQKFILNSKGVRRIGVLCCVVGEMS